MPVYNLIYIVIKMAVNFSFMKSQKGKDLLVVDEYTFSYDKKYNGSVYWRWRHIFVIYSSRGTRIYRPQPDSLAQHQ